MHLGGCTNIMLSVLRVLSYLMPLVQFLEISREILKEIGTKNMLIAFRFNMNIYNLAGGSLNKGSERKILCRAMYEK